MAHSDLDTRALDALKEFPVDAALGVLSQFLDSNLLHVSNKSAYLCGVMKTYRQKTRITPQEPFVQPPKGSEFEKVKVFILTKLLYVHTVNFIFIDSEQNKKSYRF